MVTAMATYLQTCRNTVWTHITSYHELAKTIERAHIGKCYTIVSANLDYYVVERVVKPIFSAVANEFYRHPRIYGIIAGTGMLLLISYVFHENNKPATPPENAKLTTPPENAEPTTPPIGDIPETPIQEERPRSSSVPVKKAGPVVTMTTTATTTTTTTTGITTTASNAVKVVGDSSSSSSSAPAKIAETEVTEEEIVEDLVLNRTIIPTTTTGTDTT